MHCCCYFLGGNSLCYLPALNSFTYLKYIELAGSPKIVGLWSTSFVIDVESLPGPGGTNRVVDRRFKICLGGIAGSACRRCVATLGVLE